MKPCPCCNNGERPCPTCHGGTRELVCYECDGHGYSYDVEGNAEDCDICHGDGFLPPDSCPDCINGIVDCEACDGTGEVDDDSPPSLPSESEDDEEEEADGEDGDGDDDDDAIR